jgi:hypothetical protein
MFQFLLKQHKLFKILRQKTSFLLKKKHGQNLKLQLWNVNLAEIQRNLLDWHSGSSGRVPA